MAGQLASRPAAPAPAVASAEGRRLLPHWLRAHFAAWWPVWVAFAATRVGVIVTGLLAQYAAGSRDVANVLPFAEAGTFIHYADVVQNGYTLDNATQFPVLPALMWALSQLGLPLAASAMLAVNLAFLVGLLAMAMIGERFVGRDASVRGAIYLAIWPVSHFFSIASSESLTLAAMGVAVLLAMRGTPAAWLLAGGFGAVCALTRPPGVLIGIVLLGIAISQLRSRELTGRGVAAALAAGAAIPAALIGFFLYLQERTGDFGAAFHSQEQFDRKLSLDGPWRAVSGAVDAVRSGSLGEGFELAAAFLVAAAVVAFAATAAGRRWQVQGWALFGFASLLLPLATGLVWQMPRFALLIPPLFWMLGVLGRRQWLHLAALVLLPMALAFKVVFEVVGVVQ